MEETYNQSATALFSNSATNFFDFLYVFFSLFIEQ